MVSVNFNLFATSLLVNGRMWNTCKWMQQPLCSVLPRTCLCAVREKKVESICMKPWVITTTVTIHTSEVCNRRRTSLFPPSSGWRARNIKQLLQRRMRINETLLCYALPLSARLHKVAQSHAAPLPVASKGPIWSLAASPWPHGVNQVLRWQNAPGSNKRTERAELN